MPHLHHFQISWCRCEQDQMKALPLMRLVWCSAPQAKLESLKLCEDNSVLFKDLSMAYRINYLYRNLQKEIGYANDKHHSVYDTIALAEGVDLSEFHRMEDQLANVSRNDRKTLKDFREEYFVKLGFSQVVIAREE